MARKRKSGTKMQLSVAQSDNYNMSLSRERLERQGFHPQVTTQSPQEVVDSWSTMVHRVSTPQNLPASYRMTRAFLLMREEAETDLEDVASLSPLETLITAQSVGPLIIAHVFASGHKSALNLVLTSKRIWVILAASVNYFDVYAGRLQNVGPSGVFLATAPEFTRGEMMATKLTDPYGLKSATPFTDWHNAAITREEDAINTLYMVRKRLGKGGKAKKSRASKGKEEAPEFLRNIFDQTTLTAIQSIKKTDKIFNANQFTHFSSQSVFEPQMIYAATRLQLLLIKLFSHRKNTQVLQFHQTPFFDRRMLAVVLRACPSVTMLGVYNCPLIHLGDLIPILDLIYEINEERKVKKTPLVSAFEFYPNFHRGLTVPNSQYPMYGLTADSMDLDMIQRGVYAILLKGVLKARRMKLGLLFESGKALRAFLFRLPNPPLNMPTFFDGVYRYLEGKDSTVEKRQALFDLLKPIRLGLDHAPDEELWYQGEMGRYLPFCSSCGYEMLYELFPAGTRRVDTHRRVCAGCSLQKLLDEEPHDMRDWKVGLLAKLMPDWDGRVFNKDAPMGGSRSVENDLMVLKSDKSTRTQPFSLHIQGNGEISRTVHVLNLVRDNKTPRDSLQNLPSLHDLVESRAFDSRWADLFNHCTRADIYARARQRLQAETWGTTRPLDSPTDSYGEIWHRKKHAREVQSFNYTTAVQFHKAIEHLGW